jgi:hypothetical protein
MSLSVRQLLRDVHMYYGGRYYVSRAEAPQTRRMSKLLQQSLFHPLVRVRYEIVGQDHVFEQLFTVLNQHSKTHSTAPLVILLCGRCIHSILDGSSQIRKYCLIRAQRSRKELLSAKRYVYLLYLYFMRPELVVKWALFSTFRRIP